MYSFTGGNDGGNPKASLVQGSDGSFYGTTTGGGNFLDGNIFRIVMSAPPAPPVLNLAQNGIQLVLSWPTNAPGYTLQWTTNLNPPIAWNDWTDAPGVVSTQFTVTNANSATVQFFRLKQP